MQPCSGDSSSHTHTTVWGGGGGGGGGGLQEHSACVGAQGSDTNTYNQLFDEITSVECTVYSINFVLYTYIVTFHYIIISLLSVTVKYYYVRISILLHYYILNVFIYSSIYQSMNLFVLLVCFSLLLKMSRHYFLIILPLPWTLKEFEHWTLLQYHLSYDLATVPFVFVIGKSNNYLFIFAFQLSVQS